MTQQSINSSGFEHCRVTCYGTFCPIRARNDGSCTLSKLVAHGSCCTWIEEHVVRGTYTSNRDCAVSYISLWFLTLWPHASLDHNGICRIPVVVGYAKKKKKKKTTKTLNVATLANKFCWRSLVNNRQFQVTVFSRFCYVLLCNHEYIHCLNHRQAENYITRRNKTERKL